MIEKPEPMAYVIIAPCGCTKYAGVDLPKLAKDNAREMAWGMKMGYAIQRVSCQWVRENFRYECDVCRKPKRGGQRAVPNEQTRMEL